MAYGDFLYGEKKFKITERNIPRHWSNYLWNDNYMTFTAHTGNGQGFLQDNLGMRLPVVEDRIILLNDGENIWGASGLPVHEPLDDYSCTHSHGYTDISVCNHGIKSNLRLFVPEDEQGELWTLTLTNNSNEEKTISALSYCGTELDYPYTPSGYNNGTADFDKELNGVLLDFYGYFNNKSIIPIKGFFASNIPAAGYDCTQNAFIGKYGSINHPEMLYKGKLSNTEGIAEKLGYSLEHHITLLPGESKKVSFIAAVAFSREEAVAIMDKYRSEDKIEKAFAIVAEKFDKQVADVTIHTPDEKLNMLFPWLCHQANMGSRWARVRHNGYRDTVSDCECLSAVNPKLALERLKRALGWQYSSGYAPRTVQNGAIKDNNFADNAVWISFAVSSILKELGDISILDEIVPFNDGSEATIYEHIRRSVDYLYNFTGMYGLIKIWGGDWNDCMNMAGLEGKGVSIWLSIAWCRANKMFGEIAKLYGKEEDYLESLARGEEMRKRIEEYGWDGEYYLCAYNDNNRKIGTHTADEGKIFLIPQLWSVLSGFSKDNREVIAMDAAEKYLSTPLGTLTNTPAFKDIDETIGVIGLKPQGCGENGGVYLHTIAWKIAADAMLKRAENVEKDIETILPFRNKIVADRAEPYILCNAYNGEQMGYRYGTAGQSWRTAAGPWFLKALVLYVFGLMPEMEGLKIDPCLPPSWKTARIEKKFRNATYNISYENNGTEIESITVDGKKIDGTILPYEAGKAYTVLVRTK